MLEMADWLEDDIRLYHTGLISCSGAQVLAWVSCLADLRKFAHPAHRVMVF